ncbi:MAG TPA: tetratricopeptide repeat protein [Lacipirellulaceae bacterium]|nr:tetratricopeptide repeat protein [Lacipirellulaceae bacterium]
MLIGDSVSEIGTRYSDVDDAIKRYANRDIEGARLLLDSARRKDPALPPSALILAKMHLLAGNAPAGRAALEKTAQENPSDPEPALILAGDALRTQRIIEADALYNQGLELCSKYTENPKRKRNLEIRARLGRAQVAEQRKNWPAAVADMQALLKIDPENATAHYRLGQALFMQKKYKEGFDELSAARRIDKNLPDPYVPAALFYDQQGMMNEAQQAFDRAVKNDPKDVNTLANYGQWLIKAGKLDQAEQTLAKARELKPQDLRVLFLSGVAARMNKKMKPAEDYFMEALRIAPGEANTINQLALLLIEQSDEEKRNRALQFALISSRMNAQSPDAQVTLGWVLYQLGRTGDADAALKNAQQLGAFSPDSNYLLAKILVAQNRANDAKPFLREALQAENIALFVHRQDAQALFETINK